MNKDKGVISTATTYCEDQSARYFCPLKKRKTIYVNKSKHMTDGVKNLSAGHQCPAKTNHGKVLKSSLKKKHVIKLASSQLF